MRSGFTKEDLAKKERERKTKLQEEETPTPTDNHLAQVAKFIPAEGVTFYVGVFGLFSLAKEGTPVEALAWIIFAIAFGATIFYTYFVGKKDQVPGVVAKRILATAAFVVWALALGGPFAYLSGYDSLYGTVGLFIFLLFAPGVYKIVSK